MNPIKTTPKDFFLHLAATIVLYSSAGALVSLVLSIINYAFPDALAGYYYSSSIAWPISMLVILVPVLYVVEWFIKKDIAKVPEKDTLWVRRWRNYLTLFLAGATIIGDLITLINTYINGEITQRFVWKFLAIVIIFGIIFTYYLFEKINSTPKAKTTRTIMAWLGIVVVLAAIVGGFVIVGSPGKQRAIRFDAQRVNNLQQIQSDVLNFWQTKNRLPASLAELNDPLSYSAIPKDPETKSAYEYSVKNNLTFELCATFGEKTQDNEGKGAYPAYDIAYPSYPITGGDNWKHEAGRTCFTRTIDPEKYKVNKPLPL